MAATHEGKVWKLCCWFLNETAAKKPWLRQRCVQDLLDIVSFESCPARWFLTGGLIFCLQRCLKREIFFRQNNGPNETRLGKQYNNSIKEKKLVGILRTDFFHSTPGFVHE